MVGLNLTLKLKQRVPEETDKEWIDAHIENYARDKRYVGRAAVFSFHPNYFRNMGTQEQRDSEIKQFIEDAFVDTGYERCDNYSGGKCIKKNKKLNDELSFTRKICKDHNYFTDCTKVKRILETA